MKKLTILLISLISHNIWADFSSLTIQEKAKIKKAFKQAKSQKYLDVWIDAKEKRIIRKIKKINEEVIGENEVRHTYLLDIDIIVLDKTFKRQDEFSMVTKAKIISSNGFWVPVITGVGGFVVGVLVSLALIL